MNLTVYSEKINQSSALVFWKTNADMSGLVQVELEFESNSVAIIAELIAIKELLVNQQITGSQLLSGSNLVINVSKGAIKKIIKGKSDKKEVVKFASFLNFISDGLEVNTHRWIPTESDKEYLQGRTTSVHANTIEFVQNTIKINNTPCFGSVLISEHGLRRFQENTLIESGECKRPLAALVKRISHKNLIKVKLPEKVISYKEKKYQGNQGYEVWKHPDSTLNFAFVTNQPSTVKTLVTVFINKQLINIE